MQIRFHCPTDRCVAIIEYQPLEQCGDTMQCPRCHKNHPMTITTMMRDEQRVDRCAVCGGAEMFVRKDFPQRIGLAVVVAFGLAAVYFLNRSLWVAWGILASAVLVDLVIYFVIGRVTTCYACRAEYRGCHLNSPHDGFSLATSEKYR